MLYTFISYTQKLKTILSKHCLGMDTFRSIHDTHRWFNLRWYLHVMEVGENELCYWSSQNQLSGGNTKVLDKHQPSELTAVMQYFNNPTKTLTTWFQSHRVVNSRPSQPFSWQNTLSRILKVLHPVPPLNTHNESCDKFQLDFLTRVFKGRTLSQWCHN